ncbi:hypothetical protein DFH29DRAFT_876112 [Suillus ampliporus]|nr:hypothetical protein DFH29DRAFT_876112 [Suillus ampliporus]
MHNGLCKSLRQVTTQGNKHRQKRFLLQSSHTDDLVIGRHHFTQNILASKGLMTVPRESNAPAVETLAIFEVKDKELKRRNRFSLRSRAESTQPASVFTQPWAHRLALALWSPWIVSTFTFNSFQEFLTSYISSQALQDPFMVNARLFATSTLDLAPAILNFDELGEGFNVQPPASVRIRYAITFVNYIGIVSLRRNLAETLL